VHRGDHRRRPHRFDDESAILHDAERRTEQRLGGCRAEAHDYLRRDLRDLLLQPREAGAHFARVRRLVNATLRSRVARPLEMLHRVRHVHFVAVDSGGVECVIEQPSRGTDERPALFVFHVARLFTHDEHASAARPFAENGLRGDLP